MMKGIARSLWLFSLLMLSACAVSRVAPRGQPTVFSTLTSSATITPSATAMLRATASLMLAATSSATMMPIETATYAPSGTAENTRTPVPSPRTPLPTFDRKKIVTVTPGPRAVCPVENPAVVPNFPEPYYVGPEEIVAYLNAGGPLASLDKQPNTRIPHQYMVDLTGDGVKELMFQNQQVYFSIYRCVNGVYVEDPLHMGVDGQFGGDLEEIEDVNQNGIPEIFFASFERHGEVTVFIYEWDGSAFRSLISVQQDVLNPVPNDFVMMENRYDIVDTNGDGLKEIVTVDDIGAHEHIAGMPFRRQIIILSWDGTHYVNLRPANFGPPIFRFQAAQDADRQVILGNYAQAIALYQQVISSDSLDWWSDERSTYVAHSQYPDEPHPTPYKDPDDRRYLAIYATYRLMVLHVYLGQMDKAQTEYATLIQNLPTKATERLKTLENLYAEMARAFWDSYQASQNFQNACVEAVAYADNHHEVLRPISQFRDNGWHDYIAEDMCPVLVKRE